MVGHCEERLEALPVSSIRVTIASYHDRSDQERSRAPLETLMREGGKVSEDAVVEIACEGVADPVGKRHRDHRIAEGDGSIRRDGA